MFAFQSRDRCVRGALKQYAIAESQPLLHAETNPRPWRFAQSSGDIVIEAHA